MCFTLTPLGYVLAVTFKTTPPLFLQTSCKLFTASGLSGVSHQSKYNPVSVVQISLYDWLYCSGFVGSKSSRAHTVADPLFDFHKYTHEYLISGVARHEAPRSLRAKTLPTLLNNESNRALLKLHIMISL